MEKLIVKVEYTDERIKLVILKICHQENVTVTGLICEKFTFRAVTDNFLAVFVRVS